MHDILIKQGFGPVLAGAALGGLIVYHLLYSPLPFLTEQSTANIQAAVIQNQE